MTNNGTDEWTLFVRVCAAIEMVESAQSILQEAERYIGSGGMLLCSLMEDNDNPTLIEQLTYYREVLAERRGKPSKETRITNSRSG